MGGQHHRPVSAHGGATPASVQTSPHAGSQPAGCSMCLLMAEQAGQPAVAVAGGRASAAPARPLPAAPSSSARAHHMPCTPCPCNLRHRRLLAGLVVARLTFNALLRGPTARLAAARGDTPHHRDGSKLLEELWVLAGNSLMLGAAMFVVLRRCAAGARRTGVAGAAGGWGPCCALVARVAGVQRAGTPLQRAALRARQQAAGEVGLARKEPRGAAVPLRQRLTRLGSLPLRVPSAAATATRHGCPPADAPRRALRRNGGCWFGDTRTCLRGWPALPADPAVNLYYHAGALSRRPACFTPAPRFGPRAGVCPACVRTGSLRCTRGGHSPCAKRRFRGRRRHAGQRGRPCAAAGPDRRCCSAGQSWEVLPWLARSSPAHASHPCRAGVVPAHAAEAGAAVRPAGRAGHADPPLCHPGAHPHLLRCASAARSAAPARTAAWLCRAAAARRRCPPRLLLRRASAGAPAAGPAVPHACTPPRPHAHTPCPRRYQPHARRRAGAGGVCPLQPTAARRQDLQPAEPGGPQGRRVCGVRGRLLRVARAAGALGRAQALRRRLQARAPGCGGGASAAGGQVQGGATARAAAAAAGARRTRAVQQPCRLAHPRPSHPFSLSLPHPPPQ